MFHRLTCTIKSGIDRFLSQELSPEEIEKMHLNEGLGLEDVQEEMPVDIRELFEPIADHEPYNPFEGEFNPTDPLHLCFRAFDFDARNPWNND